MKTVDIIAEQIQGNLPKLPPTIAVEVAKDIEAALAKNMLLKLGHGTPCRECGTQTRASHTSKEAAPNTIQYAANGLCMSCYRKTRKTVDAS